VVKIYRNLRDKCFSVLFRGKVIEHCDAFMLHNCEFKVSQSGRQRVLKEKRKNVHAFVVGNRVPLNKHSSRLRVPLTSKVKRAMYNPYKFNSFVDFYTLQPIYRAQFVVGTNGCDIYYS